MNAALPMQPTRTLRDKLAAGEFVVTAEFSPPDSADPAEVAHRAVPFSGLVDALNVTDGSGAHCHLSSLACCVLLAQEGFEPILQISCRDRNRIAVQGDVLGAAALGIRNVLCLTGDGVQVGDHPEAKPVFDLDSLSLLGTLRTLRDEARFLSGRPLETAPELFLGGAANPFVPPLPFRVERLAKKVAAGAQFVQTQYCFDTARLREYMAAVRERGLDRQVSILIGVGPLASARAARWIRSNVPGVNIPDAVVARLERAAKPRREGIALCAELIREIHEIPGVAGIHLMAYRQEAALAGILQQAGLRAPSADPLAV